MRRNPKNEKPDRRRQQLAKSQVYVLVDGRPNEREFDTLVEQLVAANVHVIQLREKHLSDRETLRRARRLVQLTRGSETLAIMNDRPDIAVLSGADGVHVGQDELPPTEVRQIVGNGQLIGLSTHSIEQVRAASKAAVDYIGVGPTFPSATKHFEHFTGLELLREVAGLDIDLPAFAIGGIDLSNVHDVLATGFSRVAVQSAIQSASDPCAASEQFRSLLAPAAG